jgi:hypothetical protein
VVCFEQGIGGDREYCCGNGAQLDHATVFYSVFNYEAS